MSTKDCTLRVPNESTTLFLLRVIIKAILIHYTHAHAEREQETESERERQSENAIQRRQWKRMPNILNSVYGILGRFFRSFGKQLPPPLSFISVVEKGFWPFGYWPSELCKLGSDLIPRNSASTLEKALFISVCMCVANASTLLPQARAIVSSK